MTSANVTRLKKSLKSFLIPQFLPSSIFFPFEAKNLLRLLKLLDSKNLSSFKKKEKE